MAARILNGNAIRDQIYAELAGEVAALAAAGIRPGLAAVLAGDNPASKLYVNSKIAACGKLGLESFLITPPASISTADLLAAVDQLNRRDDVDGILVQMPLPRQIDSKKILDAVDPAKDVDGFHPVNTGLLAQKRPALRPCTPYGVIRLAEEYGIKLRGLKATVVGASNIVGRPMALELMLAGATVTVCHTGTRDVRAEVERAELVVAAVGKPHFVPGGWIRPGAAVFDVGINHDASGKLVGDVEYEPAAERAGWITPVPGGLGPMTIAMLLSNAVEAASRRLDSRNRSDGS